jgi:hypothetical protein
MNNRWLNSCVGKIVVLCLAWLSFGPAAMSRPAGAVKDREAERRGKRGLGDLEKTAAAISRSSPKPNAILQIEPVDLTSMAANVPLRVTLYTFSTFGERALLEEIAGEIKLVELRSGSQIPARITVHDEEERAYRDLGYPTRIPAHVSVEPSIALEKEKWYELRVAAIPEGVVPATTGLRNMQGGGWSARFSPGSHPTLAAVRWCRIDGGGHTVHLYFSENVRADAAIREKVRLEHQNGKVICQLSLPPSQVARILDFVCMGGSDDPDRLKLSLNQATESPSGGKLEMPSRGRGGISKSVSQDMWKRYDKGCSVLELDAIGDGDAGP